MNQQDNVAAIGKIYEAFGRGDVGYIVDQLHDDVHWYVHQDKVVPTAGDWSGKANVPRFFQAIGENMDLKSFAPREWVSEGDTVVSVGDIDFVAHKTGRSANSKWVFIWKLRDGKVASYEQFHDAELTNAFR